MMVFEQKFDNKTYAFNTNKLYLPKFEIFEEMFEKLTYIDTNITFYINKKDYKKYKDFFSNLHNMKFDIKLVEVDEYYLDIQFFDMFTLFFKAKHKSLLLNILNTHTIIFDKNNTYFGIIDGMLSFLSKSHILKLIIEKQPTINLMLKNVEKFENIAYILAINIFTKLNIEGIKLSDKYKTLKQVYEKIRNNESVFEDNELLYNPIFINIRSINSYINISKNFKKAILNKVSIYLDNIFKKYHNIKIEYNKSLMTINLIINVNKNDDIDYQKLNSYIRLKNLIKRVLCDIDIIIALNNIALPDFIFNYLRINREFEYLNLLDNVKFIGYDDKFYDKHIKKFKDMKILSYNLFTFLI